jgi:hypothetical protein
MYIHFYVKRDSGSTKMTAYLRKIAKLMDDADLPLDIKCTSLRVGGVCKVVNRTGDIVVGCMRGGWGGFFSSFSNIMEYYMQTHNTLSRGGRAVSGWPVHNRGAFPPDFDVIRKACDSARHVTLDNSSLHCLIRLTFRSCRQTRSCARSGKIHYVYVLYIKYHFCMYIMYTPFITYTLCICFIHKVSFLFVHYVYPIDYS